MAMSFSDQYSHGNFKTNFSLKLMDAGILDVSMGIQALLHDNHDKVTIRIKVKLDKINYI